MAKDLNYLCNKNCANNKYGWCKINKCSVSKFKQLNIQECTFYIDIVKTPEFAIENMINILNNTDGENKYQKGYKDALSMALDVIKDCDLAYAPFKKK